MVFVDGMLIVKCHCMLLVAYCMVYHWTNFCAIIMCVYYMFMYIQYMKGCIYAHTYVMFISLDPLYNVAKMLLLGMCSVVYDDLCLLLFTHFTLLSQICHYV